MVLLVYELDNRAWRLRVARSKDWTNHEVLDISARTLVVNLFDELRLFGCVIRDVALLGLENKARDTAVGWEVHELF